MQRHSARFETLLDNEPVALDILTKFIKSTTVYKYVHDFVRSKNTFTLNRSTTLCSCTWTNVFTTRMKRMTRDKATLCLTGMSMLDKRARRSTAWRTAGTQTNRAANKK